MQMTVIRKRRREMIYLNKPIGLIPMKGLKAHDLEICIKWTKNRYKSLRMVEFSTGLRCYSCRQ